MVNREPQIISNVPRPFGELTHPSLCPEDVAFVVLNAIASPKHRVKRTKRCAIAPCTAHNPPTTQRLGIIACGSFAFAGPLDIGCLDQGSQSIRAVGGGFEDRAMGFQTVVELVRMKRSRFWKERLEDFGGGA